MTERPRYDVIAIDAGSHWAVQVPGVPGALGRVLMLEEVEDAAREVIALTLGVPSGTFDVEVVIEPYRR
jgi:hypothetical protein